MQVVAQGGIGAAHRARSQNSVIQTSKGDPSTEFTPIMINPTARKRFPKELAAEPDGGPINLDAQQNTAELEIKRMLDRQHCVYKGKMVVVATVTEDITFRLKEDAVVACCDAMTVAPQCSLRAAMQVCEAIASKKCQVVVPPGVYTLKKQLVLHRNSGLTITGRTLEGLPKFGEAGFYNRPESTVSPQVWLPEYLAQRIVVTLDCQYSCRHFNVRPGANLQLEWLQLQRGSGATGGSVHNNRGHVHMKNSIIQQNEAQHGGAVYSEGWLSVENVHGHNNRATGCGGFIYCIYPNPGQHGIVGMRTHLSSFEQNVDWCELDPLQQKIKLIDTTGYVAGHMFHGPPLALQDPKPYKRPVFSPDMLARRGKPATEQAQNIRQKAPFITMSIGEVDIAIEYGTVVIIMALLLGLGFVLHNMTWSRRPSRHAKHR